MEHIYIKDSKEYATVFMYDDGSIMLYKNELEKIMFESFEEYAKFISFVSSVICNN